MVALFDPSRFIGFPTNRFELLDEVESFLRFNGVDLGQAFEVLLNSSDGYLIYTFGDVEIQFVRGFGVWSGSSNAVQMSVEYDNEKTKKSVTREYQIRDLRLLRQKAKVTKLGGR
jgi:hypothetical protein